MTSLSQKEINSLFEFTRSKYVRYRDVQIELVDHLASGIEDLRCKDPEIGFVKALYQVYDEFGIFGFARIVEEKEKIMQKFWIRRLLRYLLDYFMLPRIIATVGSMVLVYSILLLEIFDLKFWHTGITIIGFGLILSFFYKEYMIDESDQHWLYINSFRALTSPIFFFLFYIPYILHDLISDFSLNTQFIINSLFIPISFILIYLVLVRIPRELRRDFRVQYSDYLAMN